MQVIARCFHQFNIVRIISAQEKRTAVDAVRAQAPGCSVEAICLDEYPVKVSVSAVIDGSEVRIICAVNIFLF